MIKRPESRKILLTFVVGAALFASSHIFSAEPCDCEAEDAFPTAVIADYVLGCMAANGNNYESLHKCSCSIDFIKSRMTYTEYEKAQTIMQVKLDRGQRGLFYRESSWAKTALEQLEKAQAESTLRCFL